MVCLRNAHALFNRIPFCNEKWVHKTYPYHDGTYANAQTLINDRRQT